MLSFLGETDVEGKKIKYDLKVATCFSFLGKRRESTSRLNQVGIYFRTSSFLLQVLYVRCDDADTKAYQRTCKCEGRK